MSSFLLLEKKKIHYTDIGEGHAIVLLHGYLESLKIWGEFAEELSNNFRIISIDIPGHGDSEQLSDKHSMQELAEATYLVLKKINITQCFMVGHSMGGYVTLMFHEHYPEMLSGFSLFHSHPFADSEETIHKRLREIELVKDGKKSLIANFNIPNAFANENTQRFIKEIETAKEIALTTSKQGIIANLHAMMNRPDLSESLAKTEIPFLYIAGEKDNYIDFKTIVPKIKMPLNSEFHVLKNSGHMGFIEEKADSVNIFNQFLQKHIKQ